MNGKTIVATIVAAVSLAPVAPAFAQTQAQAAAAPYSWASDLLLDHRARRIGDLVTVQITESIAASGSADSNLGKASQSDGKLPWPIPSRFSQLLQSSSDTKFTGNGTTSRAASITAIMSVRVTERLPNGDLAIEGLREIVINGDRQFVTLSGIIRTSDIAAGNVISSAFIADLRIKYFGQGFMKDNLSPGWLMRFLNKIF
jgi:flagellar L-ring protein precursor FlgH